jgi:hypothetical protein
MFASVNAILRNIGQAVLAAAAILCVLAVSGLALVLTLILAPPLRRLRLL